MALRSAPEVIGRPYVMHPDTPAEHVRTMREAFASAIKDKELVADGKKSKMELDYVGGDEAVKVMKEVLSQPKDIVDEFSKYIKFGE
jgi:tripartite-type tricarboxylate transporter receptor subunit TctC